MFATSVEAAELFSWHSFDFAERITKKVDIQVTTRIRTRDEFHLLNQFLGGPMLTYRVNSRLLYFGGYWAQPGHEMNKSWLMGHRIFGGVDRRWALKDYTFIGRLAYERHYGAGRPDHNRYRTYVRFMFPRHTVVPFLQHEYLAIRQGFFSSRQTAGMRFHIHPNVMLDVCYQYDVRRASWGGNRNAIITSVSFRQRER